MAAYPRIFNGPFSFPLDPRINLLKKETRFADLFTFKSPSHLLKLSLSHALAQSTKLSYYETAVQATTAETAYIPKELALTGGLTLDRRDAVKLTGKLFKLRVEVNLVSNVLGESSVCHRNFYPAENSSSSSSSFLFSSSLYKTPRSK